MSQSTAIATFNQATVTQAATARGQSFASVDQGNDSQYKPGHTVEQAGTSDAALISQSVQSAGNDAFIKQGVGGTNNGAAITQTNTGSGPAYGRGNSATITQNQTTGSQSGNAATITQGSFMASPATGAVVLSTGNRAGITQENELNVANLIQVGTGNKGTVMQSGNSTLKGVDGMQLNDTAGQFGLNNTLSVTQTGSLGNANIGNVSQIGTGNFSTITQTVPTP